jgi:hypothetical protein
VSQSAAPGSPPAPVAGPPSRLRRALGTPDRRAVAFLIVVPLLVFVVPALFGHPAIGGDNTIQNFPLRVLAGRMERQGHLPLWNPYIWSGNPLLGGLNAGAFYPLTFLFAVLAPIPAWVLGLLLTYWAAGLGMYALLRTYRLVPLAALLGAATYAFTGMMSSQIVHIPIVQGMGWMPLMVLAQLRLSWAVLGTGLAVVPEPAGPPGGPAAPAPAARRGSPWHWVVLLAVCVAMTVLTGEPRAMAETEIVATVVFVVLVARRYPVRVPLIRRLWYVGASLLAGVWAVLLGAIQLLPGWSFITTSQRANETYQFWASGSLRPSWTVLMLVPDLFGGDGLFGQPRFVNSYNLTEVTAYVGLLPLVAAVALLLRSVGRRRDPGSADWGLWLILTGLGILLAWGSNTPLGGLFGHIPLFDKVRLQSRNLAIADLGLAGLLGFWVDRALRIRRGAAARVPWRTWVALTPAFLAAAVCLAVLIWPQPVEFHYGTTAIGAGILKGLRPWMVVQLLVALAVIALVLGWRRLSPLAARRLLVAVVAFDLLLFTASSSTGLTDGYAVLQPSPATAASVLGNQGRFAIFDTTAANVRDLSDIGQPDLNAFTGLSSVQGYGSIVAGTYGSVTGTHDFDTLDPCALAAGTFVPLRLHTLLTLSEFLAPGYAPGSTVTLPPRCPGVPPPGTPTQRTWYLGQTVRLASVALVRIGPPPAMSPRLGVLRPSGAVEWVRAPLVPTATGWDATLATPTSAVGIVVAGPARSVSDASIVTTVAGNQYVLDGTLQDAVDATSWHYDGHWREYARFVHPSIPPPVWVGGTASGATVHLVNETDWGSEVDVVHAPHGALVVRSEAYLAGWHVKARPLGGGAVIRLSVVPVGLIQGVRVPPGNYLLTFLYRPRGLDVGIEGSLVGAAGLVVAGAWWLVRRHGRHHRKVAG